MPGVGRIDQHRHAARVRHLVGKVARRIVSKSPITRFLVAHSGGGRRLDRGGLGEVFHAVLEQLKNVTKVHNYLPERGQ